MIVLDASAAIEVLLDTELGRRVEARVWGDAKSIANAPHLLDVEVTQVLGRLVRARRLSIDFAQTLLADLQAFDLTRHPHGDLVERALELSGNVTAYDGMYVALTEALDATLVTTDGKLARVSGKGTRIEVLR